jgi:glycosyltransferase involved in cell wall biosynthesis
MAYGKPLVVCRDGGNLVNFVEHGVNGLIADPDGPSIAAAVQELLDDRSRAAELGRAARELARSYTWERTMAQFDGAIESVMA